MDFEQCNFYRCNCSVLADFSALQRMPPVKDSLHASITSTRCRPAGSGLAVQQDGFQALGRCISDVQVQNTSPRVLAFFVRLRLRPGPAGGSDGEEQAGGGEPDLVSYWSDNYVTLMPGEPRGLQVAHDGGDNVHVVAEVWNDIIHP